jgi:N-acetylglucosamine kinase-like BadF-type ATPase
MSRYLGVDGGGSKTAFALIDADGRVLARATAPSSYYFAEGFGVVERALTQGITDICTQAGIEPSDIDSAFFGLPGYGEASGDVEQLDAVPGRVLGHDRYSCDNDMVCGWAGSLAGEDGINVISGTGSMTYGERLGTGHRVGGWGELFGDEGSAYWIATQGLNAFSRMSDGRLAR